MPLTMDSRLVRTPGHISISLHLREMKVSSGFNRLSMFNLLLVNSEMARLEGQSQAHSRYF